MIIRVILLFCIATTTAARNVRFTNLMCTSLDPEFSSFETCKLKMIRRSVVGLNSTTILHKTPVTNVSVNYIVWRDIEQKF